MIVPLGHTGPHLGHPVTPGEVARPQCPGHQGAPSKAPGRVTVQAALAVVYFSCKKFFSSVQSLSRVQLFATPWTAAHQSSLSITNSQSLLKLMSIESVMQFNHLILCRPLLLPPSIFPSIRVFSNELALCIRCPKCWSFSFSISPSNEYSGLISFRID